MNVKSFILLGASEVNDMVTSFRADLEAWSVQWLPEHSGTLELELASNPEVDIQTLSDSYLYTSSESDQWIAFTASEDVLLTLSGLLLAEEAPRYLDSGTSSQIVESLAHEALCELMNGWLGVDTTTTEMAFRKQSSACQQCVSSAQQPGQGVQQLTLSIDAYEIDFYIPNRALLSRIRRGSDLSRTPLDIASIESAIQNQTVRLRAELGELELTLGALGNLRPGDIVRLDKPIAAPLSLFINDSSRGFTGFLGQRNNNLAFRVNEQLEPSP